MFERELPWLMLLRLLLADESEKMDYSSLRELHLQVGFVLFLFYSFFL
jgi:hypothetical protein